MICPICYDDVLDPSVLGCGHASCHSCLEHWFTSEETTGQTSPTCPIETCRHAVIPSDSSLVLGRAFVPAGSLTRPNPKKRQRQDDAEKEDDARGKRKESTGTVVADPETRAWLEANTLQCGGCQSQLMKESGCDKLQCLCGYRVCWKCRSVNASCQCNAGHGFVDNITGAASWGTAKVASPEDLGNFKEFLEDRRREHEARRQQMRTSLWSNDPSSRSHEALLDMFLAVGGAPPPASLFSSTWGRLGGPQQQQQQPPSGGAPAPPSLFSRPSDRMGAPQQQPPASGGAPIPLSLFASSWGRVGAPQRQQTRQQQQPSQQQPHWSRPIPNAFLFGQASAGAMSLPVAPPESESTTAAQNFRPPSYQLNPEDRLHELMFGPSSLSSRIEERLHVATAGGPRASPPAAAAATIFPRTGTISSATFGFLSNQPRGLPIQPVQASQSPPSAASTGRKTLIIQSIIQDDISRAVHLYHAEMEDQSGNPPTWAGELASYLRHMDPSDVQSIFPGVAV